MALIGPLDFAKPEYRELTDALKAGTYIFLGAGISKLAGFLLWKELSDKMVEKYWDRRELFENQDFTVTAGQDFPGFRRSSCPTSRWFAIPNPSFC